MHSVHTLLLAVEGALQHQLCKLAGVTARLHLERKETVGAEPVGVHRVGTHVRILGALQWEAGTEHSGLGHLQHILLPGEGGRVVIDVQYLHLNTVELQRALDEELQVQQAGSPGFTHLLPVNPLVHEEDPVLQVHLQVLPGPGPRHDAEPPLATKLGARIAAAAKSPGRVPRRAGPNLYQMVKPLQT
uniref:Secreted protein n=1 Tax=Aquila chrysaetos chrysaetos TaxID=223781 RepID=A0A663EM46_AQUCH